jgi:hypothetical protein
VGWGTTSTCRALIGRVLGGIGTPKSREAAHKLCATRSGGFLHCVQWHVCTPFLVLSNSGIPTYLLVQRKLALTRNPTAKESSTLLHTVYASDATYYPSAPQSASKAAFQVCLARQKPIVPPYPRVGRRPIPRNCKNRRKTRTEPPSHMMPCTV